MIAITCPVKNRAPFLPHFFQTLRALDYPKRDLAMLLVDDGSTDGSSELLRAFADECTADYGITRLWTLESSEEANTSSRDVRDRMQLFRHLAWVRNFLLDAVTILQCDAQLSVDSDIFMAPRTLTALLQRSVPYVSALVVNDNHDGTRYEHWSRRRTNVAVYSGGGFVHDTTYPLCSLIESGMAGACYVARYDALYSGARYAFHPFGEDAGYALQLRARGIPIYVDTTPRLAWHCMSEQHIPAVISAAMEDAHGTESASPVR